MISYPEALEIIDGAVEPAPVRSVPVARALGAAAARDVTAPGPVPAFANAAMDGFALASAETDSASGVSPVVLRVAGRIAAGEPGPSSTPAGSAWEIMTGAPMPAGCDAVVPVERVAARRDASGRATAITIGEALARGQNRREAGEDFAAGDPVVESGRRLDAAAILALAATGCESVDVRTAPRVGVIATGSELATGPADALAGSIPDANGPYVAAYLMESGVPVVGRRLVPDDPVRMAAEIAAVAATCDIVVTTGGVSAGGLDFVPRVVEGLGGRIRFHKVAIRPGKPVLLATLPEGKLLFGLPGNPVAVAVGLRFFVWPAVCRWLGMPRERSLRATAGAAVRRHRSLAFFAKARAVVASNGTLSVEVLPGQESFRIAPLARANCWALVPPGEGEVAPGSMLDIVPLAPSTGFPA